MLVLRTVKYYILIFVLCSHSVVQDDANFDSTHTSTTALLLPGQGKPGQGYPTQAPLSAGLWRKRLSLRGARVLEIKSTGHSRPFLLLVRIFASSPMDIIRDSMCQFTDYDL